jgi:hypothetical protein
LRQLAVRVYQVGCLLAAKRFQAALAEGETDGIYDIALARAVRARNAGKTFGKFGFRAAERLEALEFQGSDISFVKHSITFSLICTVFSLTIKKVCWH